MQSAKSGGRRVQCSLRRASVKMSAQTSGYKHFYFPVRARGEIGRLAFAAAKIDFEDIRLNGEEWVKEKACK